MNIIIGIAAMVIGVTMIPLFFAIMAPLQDKAGRKGKNARLPKRAILVAIISILMLVIVAPMILSSTMVGFVLVWVVEVVLLLVVAAIVSLIGM